MLIEQHIAALTAEGTAFVAAVERADLDAVPPTCPEWTVRELAQHVGRVHRWAESFVREKRPQENTPEQDEAVWGPMPADDGLLAWLREGHARLVGTLSAAPADTECWSFLPAPSPLAFWARRQAHETTVHRVDAQLATGPAETVSRAFSVDGVDELLMGFFSRPHNQLRTENEGRLAVVATDVDVAWTIHIGPTGARAEQGVAHADAEVSGPASELYLALWNRLPLTELELDGDDDLLALWPAVAHVRWS